MSFLMKSKESSSWKYDYFHMVGIIGKRDYVNSIVKEDKLCLTIY